MNIRLMVIRTADPKKLSGFYALLGLQFEHHRHGTGSLHYGAMVGEMVFEIYPLLKGQTEADKSLRLGFTPDDFEETILRLQAAQVAFAAAPAETEYGFMTIVTDPDGRKIELYKK